MTTEIFNNYNMTSKRNKTTMKTDTKQPQRAMSKNVFYMSYSLGVLPSGGLLHFCAQGPVVSFVFGHNTHTKTVFGWKILFQQIQILADTMPQW